MRFLCDEMLVRLARLLRAAGYDAAMAPAGTRDDELLRIAHHEKRLLLTRDKRLSQQTRRDAGGREQRRGRGAAAVEISIPRLVAGAVHPLCDRQ